MPTIKDVARLAGVAVSTASMAVNDHPRIAAGTKARVLAAARHLGYQPNAIARSLRNGRTTALGLILTDISGPFYSELIRGVEQVAIERRYQLLISSAHPAAVAGARRLLTEGYTDGAIVMAPTLSDADLTAAASRGLPLVVLDRSLAAPGIGSIRADNVAAAVRVVAHLARLGRRAIAYISGPDASMDSRERFEGYLRGMEQAGLVVQPTLVLPGDFTEEGGRRAGRRLLELDALPDAVFAGNDEMAIGLMEVLLERGVRIPEDVAVVGFDDIRLAAYVRPALTTVRQFKYELGYRAAQMLFELLEHPGEGRVEEIGTELVIRESCGYRLHAVHGEAPRHPEQG